MSLDTIAIAIAGTLATRRHKRNYVGKRRADGSTPMVPGDYLLSPAAYQLVTGTRAPVHAEPDDATGLLHIRDIHPTGQFTTLAAVNGVNTGGRL